MNHISDATSTGQRFEFGKNWQAFLSLVGPSQIAAAEESLTARLQCDSLAGKSFLDVGSGSGLFSLAARRLGARVHSFDSDPQSVACTADLKRRYFADDASWTIEQASALDAQHLAALGQFDVVYCWGVLHHTGDLSKALELTSALTAPGGLFFVALYNDQGGASRRWRMVKQGYNRLPRWLRPLYVFTFAAYFELRYAAVRLLRRRNPLPFRDWRAKKEQRGMSAWYDWVDWIGGLPFETAKPEDVIVPLRRRGFVLENITTCGGGHGCNEFVFRRGDGAFGSAAGDRA